MVCAAEPGRRRGPAAVPGAREEERHPIRLDRYGPKKGRRCPGMREGIAAVVLVPREEEWDPDETYLP